MSLTGLMQSLGLSPAKSRNAGLNVSLRQGANYNHMQGEIIAGVLPRLGLIEQTTEPGLGSVVENFSSNNPQQPLDDLDKKEMDELAELENEFLTIYSDYAQRQKNLADAFVDDGGRGAPKSADDARASLNKLFNEINVKAEALRKRMNRTHQARQRLVSKSTDLTGDLTKLNKDFGGDVEALQKKREMVKRLMQQGDTLEGELKDNTLQLNAVYMRYFVWLAAAITLGLVAVRKGAFAN